VKHHKIIRLILIIATFLLLSQIALALGLSPAKKVVYFEPNKEETITFNLINNENKDLKVFVEANGDLTEYTQITNNLVTINKNEKTKEFKLKISLPEKFEKPGLFESIIKVSEILNAEEGTTQISTKPSIKGKLQLRVPFPSKYIESRLIIDQNNEKIRFVMPIFNYGSEDLNDVKAFVKIFNNQNGLIKELETESTSIGRSSQAKLSAVWQANNIGSYYAIADINYDGESLELKERFDIGVPFINITKIIVNNFRLGDIARFDIYLKSDWNDMINAYADAIIFKGDKIYLSYKTDSIDLVPQREDAVYLYGDTANIIEGDYNLNLTIRYPQGESKYVVGLNVNKDSIITRLTPKRIVSEKPLIKYLTVAIVILMIIAALLRFKKFKKR
tara:strand:+ start:30057 stop:31226 length:1170 start_codon:yes stop_codon:yes gene_type:complete